MSSQRAELLSRNSWGCSGRLCAPAGWRSLHPELGQWVHAGTSCHLSQRPKKGGTLLCCGEKGLVLVAVEGAFSAPLLLENPLDFQRCATAVGCPCPCLWGAVTDPRAAGSQQGHPAAVGCPGSGWHRQLDAHREAEDGARLQVDEKQQAELGTQGIPAEREGELYCSSQVGKSILV